jgi:hypothetical protein
VKVFEVRSCNEALIEAEFLVSSKKRWKHWLKPGIDARFTNPSKNNGAGYVFAVPDLGAKLQTSPLYIVMLAPVVVPF